MAEASKIQREIIIKLQVLGLKNIDPINSDIKSIITQLSKAINSSTLFYKIANPIAILSVLSTILLSIGLITGNAWLPHQGLAGLTIAAITLMIIAMRFNIRIEKMENQLFLMKLLQQSIIELKNYEDEHD